MSSFVGCFVIVVGGFRLLVCLFVFCFKWIVERYWQECSTPESEGLWVLVQLLLRGISQISSVLFIPFVAPHKNIQKHQGEAERLTFT